MTSSRLKIDTSVALVSRPYSADPRSEGHTPDLIRTLSDNSFRDPLSSSTASAVSWMSPTASSTNESSSSLVLPQASSECSATTVETFNSADLSPIEGPQPEYVLAMHDYIPEQRNATCLAFRAGQVIRVLNRDPSGWWDGELDGSRGWFPSNYVNGDLALLAEDHIPHSISVRNFLPFTFLTGTELTYYYSAGKHDSPQLARPPHPSLPPAHIHLSRVPSLEMSFAPPPWFHYFMRCHCCRMLFILIE